MNEEEDRGVHPLVVLAVMAIVLSGLIYAANWWTERQHDQEVEDIADCFVEGC